MTQQTALSRYDFTFHGAALSALGEGALWWPEQSLLVVSDLHMGKSERHARRGGAALPPYEARDTIERLANLVTSTAVRNVICLGDSFDDDAAASALEPQAKDQLQALTQNYNWVWIEGNHDPAPSCYPGTSAAEITCGPLVFRHIATEGPNTEARGEVSGHYHPKAMLKGQSRPSFLVDEQRLILPAFGTYTGGLNCDAPVLQNLMGPNALAILTGPTPLACPLNELQNKRGFERTRARSFRPTRGRS